MTIHAVKIEKKYHDKILSGVKTCEIRNNDRMYKKGDTLMFRILSKKYGYNLMTEEYKITHITRFPEGLQKGYVALSIKKLPNQ